MDSEIVLTSETKAFVVHQLEKNRKRWEKRHPVPPVEERVMIEIRAELNSIQPERIEPIMLSEISLEELTALEAFVRSLRYQRSIMNIQDGRKENMKDYETILRKELAEMEQMKHTEVLRRFGFEEAIWKLEGYLLRYN